MNVLLLCEGDPETRDSWSGISKSVVEALRRAGHRVLKGDVDLYGLDKLVAAATTYSPNRTRWWVKYHLAQTPFRLRSQNARRAIARYRDQTDLILQFGATFEPRGRGDIPYVLYCDSNIALAERDKGSGFGEAVTLKPDEIGWIRRREGAVYRGASTICTISDYSARSFVDDFSIPRERTRAVYAGANIDLSAIPAPRPGSRANLPPSILFVGRQFGRKGGDLLLQAFRKVHELIPEATLTIVGPRDLKIDQPGVQNLGLLNKDDDQQRAVLENLYRTSRVFCMPSRFDCFPISFLEAMAFGIPCIGTNIAGVPEIIDDGVTGLLVPPEDPDLLAMRLLELLADPRRAERLGLAGRLRLEDRFTWDRVVAGILDSARTFLPQPALAR